MSNKKPIRSTKREKLNKIIYHEVFIVIAIVLIISLIIGIFAYYQINSGRIYVEKSSIIAPIISLKSSAPGILKKVYVNVGDHVLINSIVAQVGDEKIVAKTSGIITYVNNVPGQYMSPRDTIVKMYNPKELRVVGQIQEDKGLSNIENGQRVIFTADAFGSKKYYGIVEEISPSSRESDVVFSISDKREEKSFDVIVKFDSGKYPELKNGMSARMWIYKTNSDGNGV